MENHEKHQQIKSKKSKNVFLKLTKLNIRFEHLIAKAVEAAKTNEELEQFNQ